MADQSEKDDAVRQLVTQHGDDPTRAHATVFYFYGGDLQGLTEAAVQQHFTVDLREGRAGAEDCAVLSTTTALDEETFQDFNDLFDGWAEEFGSRHDGWETELGLN